MKDENGKYVRLALSIAGALSVSIILYFMILRISDVSDAVGVIDAILKPFVYGAVIAYLLTPLCRRLERLFKKAFKTRKEGFIQAIAVFCALLIGILIIILIVLLIIPALVKSVSGLIQVLPSQLDKATAFMEDFLDRQPVIIQTLDSWTEEIAEHIEKWLNTSVLPNLQSIGLSLFDRVAGIVTVFKNLLLGLIIALYLLLKRGQFAAQAKLCLRSILPGRWYRIILTEAAYADRMFNGFFMGKLKDSVIIGFICFIGCLVLGYGSPLLIAVIIGITNIIPFFGPFIGAVPCALLLVLENPVHCLTFIIFVIILQLLDGNVIGPKILGDTTGLSSFWVLFSILFFGGLWGVTGMMIGVPLFAVIYDVIRTLVFKSLRKKGETALIEDYERTFKHDEKAEGSSR
ncbi:MAG: AI-2E family transporter [Lachnospiraceae bacterium]|nr:AI-2E family transporter [Lachnospiraceae bacterium]